MTAFLFIPSQPGHRLAHRVDFANIASLFVEPEEPLVRTRSLQGRVIRITAFAVIVVSLLGDVMFVARPTLVSPPFFSHGTHGRVTS